MGHSTMEQPDRNCPYNHDKHSRSGQGCRQGCSCQCMFCLSVRATAESKRRDHCPTGDDTRETCPSGCNCGCKTCTQRRVDNESRCPNRHHVFMGMPAASCPQVACGVCSCECGFCERARAAEPLAPCERCGKEIKARLVCCEDCKGRRAEPCPKSHDRHGVSCPRVCDCGCFICVGRMKSVWSSGTCPSGHFPREGKHIDFRPCQCPCDLCVAAMRVANAPESSCGVDLPCPYAHDQSNTRGCREGCLCQCRHCVAFVRYLRFVRESCPNGHARPDGSHDGVSPPPGCQCKCMFCENKRAGYACPFRHDSLLAPGTDSHECSCFCTFCVSHRNGGPPAMNESPNRLVHPAPKLVRGSGRRTVTIKANGQWPLNVAPSIYEGEVCRVQKVTGDTITLEVVGDMAELPTGGGNHTVTVTPRCFSVPQPSLAFTPGLMVGQVARVVSFGEESLVLQIFGSTPQDQKPLPPPINYVVMPRLTPLQVAQILSHMDAFVQASLPGVTEPFTVTRQPFDAVQILAMAAKTPLACEDYRRHRIGNAAAGIIDILCGKLDSFDVEYQLPKTGLRVLVVQLASDKDQAVGMVLAAAPQGSSLLAAVPSPELPLFRVTFTGTDSGGDMAELVRAAHAADAIARVKARWHGIDKLQAVEVADRPI